jgi:hypothetical protein
MVAKVGLTLAIGVFYALTPRNLNFFIEEPLEKLKTCRP